MKQNILSITSFSLLLLSGCATYKASESGLSKAGYEEHVQEDGSYQLSYYGTSFNEHDDLIELWHRRAAELCNGESYEASTQNDHWVSDGYTVLPPFIFKSKSAGPVIVGNLRCKQSD